jgi:hypothetical protein
MSSVWLTLDAKFALVRRKGYHSQTRAAKTAVRAKHSSLFCCTRLQWVAQNRRDAIALLLESQRHWLAHRSTSFASIAVRENSFGMPAGEHVHQIVHIPLALQREFIAHTKQFLTAGKPQQKALAWDSVYSRGILAYLCKGATADGRALILKWLPTEQEREAFKSVVASKPYQGVIYGKRLLISHSLFNRAVEVEARMAAA